MGIRQSNGLTCIAVEYSDGARKAAKHHGFGIEAAAGQIIYSPSPVTTENVSTLEFSDPNIEDYGLTGYAECNLIVDQYDDIYIKCGNVTQYTGMSIGAESPSNIEDWSDLEIIAI